MGISVVRRLNEIDDLPTIPHTMQQVLAGIEDEASSAETLQKIIEQDPSLTSKILKVANSSYYSPATEISTVSRAIVMLGFNEIRSLVVSFSLSGLFPEDLGFAGFNTTDLWLHSIGVGTGARLIARQVGGLDPDEMFTAGIIHDLGRLIYCLHLKNELHAVLAEVESSGSSLDQAEEKLGLTHGEVGGYLALRWKLSDLLIDVITYHHKPQKAGAHARAAAVISLADALAIKLGIGWPGIGEGPKVVVPKILGLDVDTAMNIARQLKVEKERIISGWSEVIGGK